MKKTLMFKMGLLAAVAIAVQVPMMGAEASLKVVTDRAADRLDAAVAEYQLRSGLPGDAPKVVAVTNAEQAVGSAQAPGPEADADLILVKDLAIANRLILAGAVKPFEHKLVQSALKKGVFPFMVDQAEGNFIGLSARLRTLAYSQALEPELVRSLQTYADLAKPEWAGRLCLRTSQHDYNRVLIAGLSLRMGSVNSAVQLLTSWVQNLAKPVMTGDRTILQEIAAGNCDVGLVNHYYWANEKDQNPNFPVLIKSLDQGQGGGLVNGSLVLRSVKSRATDREVQDFVESLLSESSQLAISGTHNELPAVQTIRQLKPNLMGLWPLEPNRESWSQVRAQLSTVEETSRRSAYP